MEMKKASCFGNCLMLKSPPTKREKLDAPREKFFKSAFMFAGFVKTTQFRVVSFRFVPLCFAKVTLS
jgi:hypothetical protein